MAIDFGKSIGRIPRFDPAAGTLVRSPLGAGPGWWAGAPGATFDDVTNTFFLTYRLRQPRELGRGVECRIAASDDGIAFTDIWAMPKTSLGATSLERASLLRGADGRWMLYIGYVSPADNRWRIALLEAGEPDGFDVSGAVDILSGDQLGVEGVKDPNVFQISGMTYMLASYATREALDPSDELNKHATGDIYNTGLTKSRTGAAISGDGRRFQWLGDISPISNYLPEGDPPVDTNALGARNNAGSVKSVAAGTLMNVPWDNYCRRIGALVPIETGGFMALYDGGRDVTENYEERTGLAITFDLKNYYSLTPDGPYLEGPGGGSLRYVDVVALGHELFHYYEIVRPDGAHELRVSVVERP